MAVASASVLTVEDDPIVRADLRLVLEGAGFSVCPDARDGVEAVELARRHRPDVVLLDLGLPRLDGVEATRRIRAERDIPVVALTGRSRALAEEAMEAGASSYVMKPFVPDQVVVALVDAIASRETRALREARAESRQNLSHMLSLLGYPEEWAVDLEQRAYEGGRLWRITPPGWTTGA